MANDGTGTGWDNTSPANAEFFKDGAQEIRDLRKGTEIRINKEHDTLAAASGGGEHKEGSAKAYYESAAPTNRPDGSTALGSADAGRLWLDSDDQLMRHWDGSAWSLITAGDITADTTFTAGVIPASALVTSLIGAALAITADVLDVKVDGSTIEVDTDALRVKDLGITFAKLAATGFQFPREWAKIEDVKGDGTDGGTFTAGSWQTRDLNTKVDPDTIVTTLAANRFTLAAGTYLIRWWAPTIAVGSHQTRIRNISDTTTLVIGRVSNNGTGDSDQDISFGLHRFTIAGAKIFELQHICETTKATTGFGEAGDFSVGEVYAQVEIQKEL